MKLDHGKKESSKEEETVTIAKEEAVRKLDIGIRVVVG